MSVKRLAFMQFMSYDKYLWKFNFKTNFFSFLQVFLKITGENSKKNK